MNWLLALVSIFSMSLWFTFKKSKLLTKLAIPLFYISTLGLMSYFIYRSIDMGQTMWIQTSFFFLKFSVFSLLLLAVTNSKKARYLSFLIAPLALFWIGPQLNFQVSKIFADDEGEILIHLDDQLEYQQISDALNKYNFSLEKAFVLSKINHPLQDYYILDVNSHDLNEVTQIIKNQNFIDHYEYNETVQVEPILADSKEVSNRQEMEWEGDPLFSQQWGLQALNPTELTNILKNSSIKPKKVKIAILDTGVDSKHEDLVDVYTSTKSKYDKDNMGHGTHCAGIAAATNHNLKGIASLPLNNFVEITSITVLNRFGGSGTQQSIIQGMIDASDAGAQVLSMSLGGRTSDDKQLAYELAVEYANERGAIVVVAAGNNGGDARDIAPANVKGVITVAAVDQSLNRASFSNSVEYIDMGIAAPGVNIVSCIPGNKYKAFNGTSMATPFVASLVGIIKCIRPESDTKEVFQILNQNSLQTLDQNQTGSIIDPVKSIESILN